MTPYSFEKSSNVNIDFSIVAFFLFLADKIKKSLIYYENLPNVLLFNVLANDLRHT